MELYKEILIEALSKGRMEVFFPELEIDGAKIVEMECYRALCRIRDIIRDERLSDGGCFQQIEEVVCTLENIGSGGGSRHDFG